MLSADDLAIFLEVARRGRLTEAAKHLGINHTTVGRHISRLERAVGQRLFLREPAGWVLSEPGLRLLSHAESVEAAVRAAREDCLETGEHLTGSVRAITPEGLGAYLLTPGLARMRERFSGINVEVVTANRHASLTTREFDIAITIEKPQARAVDVRLLARYELRLYGAPSYLNSRAAVSSVEDLSDHDFIWYVDEALGVETYETLHHMVPGVEPCIQSNNITAQIRAAQEGLGLAYLPTYIGDRLPGLERLEGFDSASPRSYWMIAPRNLSRLARIRALTSVIEQLVHETEGLAHAG
ncbi:LysR family transcriptional regulator [Nocardioides sp. JQ2195]|nr:LysR family transcriptional regulator [Nocardioides sp. JQ2195]